MTETNHTLQGIWHSSLILLLSGFIITGLGYLFHLRFGHNLFTNAGALIGTAAGLMFCTFVVARLHKRSRETHTNARDRDNDRLTFPRYVIGLTRYGIVTGGAILLGLMAWIGAEDYALERPLDGPFEIILGLLVSISIGLTTFHVLLKAVESD